MAEQPITAELVLEKLRHHRLDWAQRFHVVDLGLFGSLARATARHQSNIDIWVRLDPLTPYALVHLKHELEELLPGSVDLVRLREQMNPSLRQRMEQEGLKA